MRLITLYSNKTDNSYLLSHSSLLCLSNTDSIEMAVNASGLYYTHSYCENNYRQNIYNRLIDI